MKKINKLPPHFDEYLVYSRKSTDDSENQKNSIAYQTGQGLVFSKKTNLPIADYTLNGFSNNGIIEEKHSAFKTDKEITMRNDGTIAYKIERPKFQLLVQKLLNHQAPHH